MKIIDLRTLKQDTIILERLFYNLEYIEQLNKITNIVNSLDINDEATYYYYQVVLDKLNGFSYFEATFLNRIKDEQYLNIVFKSIGKFNIKDNKRKYSPQIIEFKKR